MASTNHTPNLGLPQWLSTDKPSWLGDMNAAFLDIDTAVQENKVAVDSAASAAASAQGSAEAAKNSAEEASTSAGNAIAAAQSATSIAQGAVTTATNAGNKADAASTAAAAAQTAATTAQDTANAANTAAQAAQTTAGAAATAANQAKATAESAIDVANAVADDVANFDKPSIISANWISSNGDAITDLSCMSISTDKYNYYYISGVADMADLRNSAEYLFISGEKFTVNPTIINGNIWCTTGTQQYFISITGITPHQIYIASIRDYINVGQLSTATIPSNTGYGLMFLTIRCNK